MRCWLHILLTIIVLSVSPAWAQQEMRSATKGTSTPLPITGTVIDANHNALDVNVLAGGGGGGGGTQYTEDNASAGGESMNLAGSVRRDTAASSAGTDGDYATVNTDATGRLWTNTELPDATAASDAFANPTAPSVIAHLMCFDGSTWLRQPRVSDTDAIGVSGNNCRTATMSWIFNGTSWDRTRSSVAALNSAGTGLTAAQIVGQFDDVSPTAITENQFGNLRMSANRNFYTTLRDAAGNERGLNIDANGELGVSAIRSALPAGTNAIGKLSANSGVDIGDVDVTSVTPGTTASALGKAEDAAHASGDVGVMSLCVRAASATDRSAGATDGDYEPCAVDANGKLWTNADTEMPAAATLADDTANPTVPGVASFNMCFDGTNWDRCTKATAGQGAVDTATQRVTLAQGSTACPNYVAISQTADTTLVSGTSSQYFYICSIILVAGAAEVVSLWEGTGTACGTGSTAILGSTTEANGLSVSANGGFSAVSGIPFLRTATTANDICLRQSGTNRVSGVLTYYKAP